MTWASVLHFITPYDSTVTVSQILLLVSSTRSIPMVVIVAPGAKAVMIVPPTEPEFGEIEANCGVISIEDSTIVWFSGIPTAK